MRAKGIDISHWQGMFKDQGNIDFIIIKATEETEWIDPDFENHIVEAETVPIRGAYHYFRTAYNPFLQAIHFYETTKKRGFHFLAVDYEKTNNTLDWAGENNFKKFWDYLHDLTSLPVVLYTSPYIFRDNLCAYNVYWKDVPLWMAHYNGLDPQNAAPTVFGASGWLLWQYSCTGKGGSYGVESTYVDENVFNGTIEEMNNLMGIILPIPGEDQMSKWYASKTLWFSVLFGLVNLAGIFGYGDFTPSPEVVQYVGIAVSVIGAIVGVVVKYFENKD